MQAATWKSSTEKVQPGRADGPGAGAAVYKQPALASRGSAG